MREKIKCREYNACRNSCLECDLLFNKKCDKEFDKYCSAVDEFDALKEEFDAYKRKYKYRKKFFNFRPDKAPNDKNRRI